MNDDTDKLAAKMQKLRPSKSSRESGLSAAMAAFNQEFAAETAAKKGGAKTASSEKLNKNSTPTQGIADGPRPTGQPTKTVSVKTRRVDTMSKFKSAFNFKPQTMMMAGTCSAALIAAMIILPNMEELSQDVPLAKSVPVEVVQPEIAPENTDEIVVTGSRGDSGESDVVNPVEDEEVEMLSEDLKSEEAKPVEDDVTPQGQVGPQTIVKTRRVLKTPARTTERTIPSLAKTETRRRVKTPASTVERSIPAVTKQVSRRIPKGDGTFETVNETVVVQAASVEYVNVPPVYETFVETVVVQEASTELVTIPATFDTIRETIEIQADGTETVISTEVVADANAQADQAEREFRTALQQKDNIALFETQQSVISQTPPPPQIASANRRVSDPRSALSRRDRGGALPTASAPSSSSLPEKVDGLTLEVVPSAPVTAGRVSTNTSGQFTVFNGVSNQVVQSTETVVNQTGEILARVLIPAKYKTITKQVLVSPARTEEVTIPAVTKEFVVKRANGDGTFREEIEKVVIEEERVDYVITPAQYETRSERVLVEPAREEWKPGSQAVNAGAIVQKPVPPKYILRDDDGNVVREFESRDAFEIYKANLPTPVAEKPVSTFSVDVDTAAYSFLRASINRGQLPPRESIRLEEMINYFPYDYEAPKSADQPFKANVTVTPTPWNVDTKLMHIGIKGYVPKETEKPRNNLVLLIDTSGSMKAQNKLPLLINSFKLLLNTLDKDDTVSIVTYANNVGTALEPTPVRNKSVILAALQQLRAHGGTAGAAGLQLAYEKAEENFDDEGNNRVILATDGDFNIGFSSPDEMKAFISKKRETGISLSVMGFGEGNYNDHLMQSLAQNGNGVAAYIDSLAEANKVLANEAGSSLITIAKDVKIQVEFNPAQIAEYRLIGYETRALKRQDFNNDKVDAGEIGAGHSVTAIYEMTPVGSPAVTVDKLRYVSEEPKTTGSDEYAYVKIRHKLPKAEISTLQTFPIGKGQEERSLNRASHDMRFATAVAAVGQKLRGDVQLEDYSYKDAIKLAQSGKGDDEDGYRAEFIQMTKLIDNLEESAIEEVHQKSTGHRR